METTEKKAVTKVNIETLKKANYLLEGFTQTPADEINNLSINLKFYNFADLGSTIESLLNAISLGFEDENSLEKGDIVKISEVTKSMVQQLPFEFLDRLLIKENYNENDFKSIENL